MECKHILCVHAFAANNAILHNLNMQHNIPELLRKMMEAGQMKQSALASRLSIPKKLKIDQPQISRWIKGQEPERLSYDRIVDVAHQMGVLSDVRSEDVAATLPEREVKTVKLKGYVGASGEAFYYRLADEDLEEVLAPDNATDQTVAVEVRGKSLGPALESWLVFYADVRSPITPDTQRIIRHPRGTDRSMYFSR